MWLKTRHGSYLQTHSGPPPLGNMITHDLLRKDGPNPLSKKILWHIEIVDSPSDTWKQSESIVSKMLLGMKSFVPVKQKDKEQNTEKETKKMKGLVSSFNASSAHVLIVYLSSGLRMSSWKLCVLDRPLVRVSVPILEGSFRPDVVRLRCGSINLGGKLDRANVVLQAANRIGVRFEHFLSLSGDGWECMSRKSAWVGCYIAYPTPHALLSVSPSTWHQRLGHPGEDVLRSLKSRQYISYNKEKSLHLCQLPLGNSETLSFTSSDSIVTRSFEIVHSDIWTSSIASSGNIYLQQSHKDLPRSVRRTDAFLCKSLAEATKRTIFHINE
ncbi:hypothetical protein Tco_0304851 [Tanacetum coccineum]